MHPEVVKLMEKQPDHPVDVQIKEELGAELEELRRQNSPKKGVKFEDDIIQGVIED